MSRQLTACLGAIAASLAAATAAGWLVDVSGAMAGLVGGLIPAAAAAVVVILAAGRRDRENLALAAAINDIDAGRVKTSYLPV